MEPDDATFTEPDDVTLAGPRGTDLTGAVRRREGVDDDRGNPPQRPDRFVMFKYRKREITNARTVGASGPESARAMIQRGLR